jgi:hypothetical protein
MEVLGFIEKAGPYVPVLGYVWIVVACVATYIRSKYAPGLTYILLAMMGVLMFTLAPSWTYESDVPWWINYSIYAFLPALLLLPSFLASSDRFGKSAQARSATALSLADILLLRVFLAAKPAPAPDGESDLQPKPRGLIVDRARGSQTALLALVIIFTALIGLAGVGLQPCYWLDLAVGRSGCVRQLAYGGSVQTLTFSPDGSIVAVGGSESTVELRRVADGQLLNTLTGHSNWVTNAAFSPNGALLATESWDKTLRLWDVATGIGLRTMRANVPNDNLISLAYAHDGQTIAAGTGGGTNEYTIWLWRAQDGNVLRTFRSGGPPVAFSKDGTILASVAQDEAIALSRVSDGASLRKIPVGESWAGSPVAYLAFSPDGATLAYVSISGLHLVRISDGTEIRSIDIQTSRISPALAFSPDWSLLAYTPSDAFSLQGDSGKVELRRLRDGAAVANFVAGRDLIDAMAFAPGGNLLALATPWRRVRIWRTIP